MYRFIDLFAGIGGFRVALQKLGMKCVFSSEIDEHAQMVYQRNFHDKPRGDICDIKASEIPKHDILCAGFPCQSFSIAGKKSGLDDCRGRLFYEILRVVEYHKPLVLLLENVRNILTVDKGEVLKTIETRLDEVGYSVHYSLLDASDYGIPQSRERVYFSCLRKGSGLGYKKPQPDRKDIFLRDVLDEVIDERLIIHRDDITIEKNGEPPPAHKPIRIGHLNKGGQGERIYHPNGHAITLAADSGGVGSRTGLYLIDGVVRRLSISECKRLMGFGINHVTDIGSRGYRQLGNAVIPDMVTRSYDSITI